jgi:hypothetical protein
VADVRSSPIACPKDAPIKLLSSAIIIPLCSALAAVVSAGPQRTFGSISVIAGARRAFTAKPRHGTDLHAPSGGPANMKIQAYLTAAAINLKRLAAAVLALLRNGHSAAALCRAPSPSKPAGGAVCGVEPTAANAPEYKDALLTALYHYNQVVLEHYLLDRSSQLRHVFVHTFSRCEFCVIYIFC